MNLSFSASLRIGELTGLTWDCVDISEEAIEEGRASIHITKEYQRVSKEAVEALDGKDIILVLTEKTLFLSSLPRANSTKLFAFSRPPRRKQASDAYSFRAVLQKCWSATKKPRMK